MDKNIIHAELIGKHAKVIMATNKSLIGLEGMVVNETRNTLVVQTEKGIKRAQKHGAVFEIDGQEASGDDLLAAPEERMVKK